MCKSLFVLPRRHSAPRGSAFGGLLPGGNVPVLRAGRGLVPFVLRGLGAGATLVPAAIILAWALAFFAVAVWRFRFE